MSDEPDVRQTCSRGGLPPTRVHELAQTRCAFNVDTAIVDAEQTLSLHLA